MKWKPGDLCKFVNLREGEVLEGHIETMNGHHMVVVTADGRRWKAEADSSFVQRRDEVEA